MMNQRLAGALLAVVALGLPSSSLGAGRPRISIAGVRGDPGGSLARQLATGLCNRFECVPASRVKKGGSIDFRAAQAQRVGVLFGTAAGTGTRRRLELALLTTSLTPQRSWALPLANGRLPRATLSTLAEELRAELVPPSEAPRAPAVAAAPAAEPAPAPAPAPPPLQAEPGADRPAAGAASAASVAAAPPPPRAPPRPPPPPPAKVTAKATAAPPVTRTERFAAVDLGVDVAQRDLSYTGVGTGSVLLTYSAKAIVSPGVRVELSPLAGAADRWYSGATAFASYFHSVGLHTQEPGGASSHPTAYTRLDAGAGLRFRPVPSARATLLARASYRTLAVKVAEGGIAGLPDTDLAGPSVGLDLEAPIGSRWALLAGAAYTWWLRARELVGDGYFPDGSAWGLDASAGVSVIVHGPASLRLTVDYSRTSYSLSGTSAYSATGATDAYLGGRAVLRLAF